MGYLGTKPANSPLTSELIPDGLIATSDLANGSVTQDKLSTYIAPKGTPAFSAYASSATSLATGGATKVLFDTEIFDTNSNFTSSRFTPTVAGYYQMTATVGFAAYQTTETILAFYKNGGLYRFYNDQIVTRLYYFGASDLIYCNGTTDYIEVYVYQYSGSSVNTATGSTVTSFSGAMLRAA